MNVSFFRAASLRRSFAALALLAVAILLAQPVCEAAEARALPVAGVEQAMHAGHSNGDGAACCHDLQAIGLSAAAVLTPMGGDSNAVVPSAPSAMALPAQYPERSLAGSSPALPTQPYCARSARLLR